MIKVNSDLRLFDDLFDGLITGNVTAPGQKSSYIRAYNDHSDRWTPQGMIPAVDGANQAFDLEQYTQDDFWKVPAWVIDKVRDHAKSQKVCFYIFYHFKGGKYARNGETRIVDCCVITDVNDHILWIRSVSPRLGYLVEQAIRSCFDLLHQQHQDAKNAHSPR